MVSSHSRSADWEESNTWWTSWITRCWKSRGTPAELWGTLFTANLWMKIKLPWGMQEAFQLCCACWGRAQMLKCENSLLVRMFLMQPAGQYCFLLRTCYDSICFLPVATLLWWFIFQHLIRWSDKYLKYCVSGGSGTPSAHMMELIFG